MLSLEQEMQLIARGWVCAAGEDGPRWFYDAEARIPGTVLRYSTEACLSPEEIEAAGDLLDALCRVREERAWTETKAYVRANAVALTPESHLSADSVEEC